MEIQESNTVIFCTSRAFGLAPYLLRRTPKGRIAEYALSVRLCGYSVAILLAMVILTCRGLIVDAGSTSPVRMTSATSKFVTSFDVIVVVGACLFGVVCGVVRVRYTREFNEKLREIDDVLTEHTDLAKDRRKDITMMVSVFVTITAMIAMDLVSRYRILYRITPTDKIEVASANVLGYIPFYVLYYMLMALHTQFAQSALGIGRRFRRLNNALQLAFPIVTPAGNTDKNSSSSTTTNNNINGSRFGIGTGKKNAVHIIRVMSLRKGDNRTPAATATGMFGGPADGPGKKAVIVAPAPPPSSLAVAAITNSSTTTTATAPENSNIVTRENDLVDRLAYTHALLGESVGNVSSAYGAALLAMLVSCLLHLVATSYFLFVEILGNNDLFFSTLQFLWLFFHVTRLLLIVEPCHTASAEARRTIVLVCEIIRSSKDASVVYCLKKFWRQLLAERAYKFSACGMCNINRQILTSLAAAIATYLVILIQFQKSEPSSG